MFGTGIRAESGGLLHRASITTIQLLQPRTRFHARGIVATRTLGGNAGSSRCREDPPGDQLYDAQQEAAMNSWYFTLPRHRYTTQQDVNPLLRVQHGVALVIAEP